MTEDFPSRASLHQRSAEPEAEGPVEARKHLRVGLIALIALLVLGVVAAGVWFFGFRSPAGGVPAAVPLPPASQAEELVDTGSIMTFSVTVESAAEMEAVVQDFKDSWELVGENIVDETDRTYSFTKNDLNATIKLMSVEGTQQIVYALSGKGVGSGK